MTRAGAPLPLGVTAAHRARSVSPLLEVRVGAERERRGWGARGRAGRATRRLGGAEDEAKRGRALVWRRPHVSAASAIGGAGSSAPLRGALLLQLHLDAQPFQVCRERVAIA